VLAPTSLVRIVSRAFFIPILGVGFISTPVQAQTSTNAERAMGLANPASRNCVDKGGRLSLEANGSGGQFGVCTFTDNLQCEEWAMMRGDCRVGGIKVTGFVTPAARYCAITGGTYQVTSDSRATGERGICTFKGGSSCAATAYFNGTCAAKPGQAGSAVQAPKADAIGAAKTIHAVFACEAGKTVDATFINGAQGSVELILADGRKLTLPQTRSGSGARYANAGETFVFWNKGDTAFIEENGKTTYTGCSTKNPGQARRG
jgi:putative hemolysin